MIYKQKLKLLRAAYCAVLQSLGKGEDSNSVEHNILMWPWESALIIKSCTISMGGIMCHTIYQYQKSHFCSGQSGGPETDALTQE